VIRGLAGRVKARRGARIARSCGRPSGGEAEIAGRLGQPVERRSVGVPGNFRIFRRVPCVNDSGRALAEVLADDAEVSRHFDRAALDRLTDPANYLGLAPAMVDRVIAQSARLSAP
jgi:Adenylosuccinate lyase C-terminus